ncbi:Ribosomal protein L34e superfamily protein [Striga hermonthica]|uniref:Ribosomal protein L34e superfamily protein n=1 Tax=Striga hermonthica TaxID=68872 RepID=A0A9N7ML93_STRHE|nr:Ribosomal protein L34e superfamily protein [Striga hermonthica]
MRIHPLFSIIPMAPSSSVRKPPAPKTPAPSAAIAAHHHSNSANCPSLCRHSPSATLDLLIFVLVLFSGAFLIISYFSYVFQSLSLLLPSLSAVAAHLHRNLASSPRFQLIFFAFFAVSFVAFAISFEICWGHRSRRCGRKGCRGLRSAMEFDLQLQGEDLLRAADGNKAVRDVDDLPWKGGAKDNPDYECLRAELRKMAPPNGRAVLLFRDRCGCPVSKLEGWWPKRGRRHKKSLALTGGGDNP